MLRKSPACSPWSVDECSEALLRLHREGLTGEHIADAMKAEFAAKHPDFTFSRANVLARLRRLGLKGNGPKHFPRGTKSAISHFTRRPRRKRTKDEYRYDVGRLATDATADAIRSTRIGACKFPIGDPRDDDFRFCGAEHTNDGPYCTEHHILTHQPASASATARARMARDLRIGLSVQRPSRRFMAH